MRTIRKTIFLTCAIVLTGGYILPAARADEPEDVGELGAILGYVAEDYAGAVGPTGGVSNAQELGEQRGFLTDAVRLSAELGPADADIPPLVQAARDAALRAAPADAVIPRVQQVLELLGQRHDLGRIPKQRPSFAHGQELYAQACAACHAADGSGHTALHLTTRPPDLSDPAQAGSLSPARVFAAASYGVPGTAMPAFNLAYPESDRWDLAFYFMSLAHPAAQAAAPEDRAVLDRYALADLAVKSDDQLRAELRRDGAAVALGTLRRIAPYAAPPAAAQEKLLAAARQEVARAESLAKSGDLAGARRAAIAADLDHFEPFEAPLRAKDPALVAVLETDFGRLRAALEGSDVHGAPRPSVAPAAQVAPQIDNAAADLERALLRAEDVLSSGSGSMSFAASLAIALREGLESALLLSALLALAVKSGRPRARLAVHTGWMAALLAGAITWFLSGKVVQLGGRYRELTEGIAVLATAALLLAASHWLLAQASAKRLTGFLARRAKQVQGAGWGIAGLAFLAIYREMFEVAVFYRGLLLQSPGQGRAVGAGLAVGLILLAIIVSGFQSLGRKLKPRPLLLACGVLLCGLAIVMVGEGVRALQEAGVIGQRVVPFPEFPELGIFATAQGLVAQAAVLAALVASAAHALVKPQVTADSPRRAA